MSDKGADLLARKWTREPLHVVLHENLHGRALDGTGALDRGVDSAANGHVSAEENFGMRNADCGMRARMSLSAISWLLHSRIPHSPFRIRQNRFGCQSGFFKLPSPTYSKSL